MFVNFVLLVLFWGTRVFNTRVSLASTWNSSFQDSSYDNDVSLLISLKTMLTNKYIWKWVLYGKFGLDFYEPISKSICWPQTQKKQHRANLLICSNFWPNCLQLEKVIWLILCWLTKFLKFNKFFIGYFALIGQRKAGLVSV